MTKYLGLLYFDKNYEFSFVIGKDTLMVRYTGRSRSCFNKVELGELVKRSNKDQTEV